MASNGPWVHLPIQWVGAGNQVCLDARTTPNCSLLVNGQPWARTCQSLSTAPGRATPWVLEWRGHNILRSARGVPACPEPLQTYLYPAYLCSPATLNVTHVPGVSGVSPLGTLVRVTWQDDDWNSTSQSHQWMVREGQGAYWVGAAFEWNDWIDWNATTSSEIVYRLVDMAYGSCPQQVFRVARPITPSLHHVDWWARARPWCWSLVVLFCWQVAFLYVSALVPLAVLLITTTPWTLSWIAFALWWLIMVGIACHRFRHSFPRSHEWKWVQRSIVVQLCVIIGHWATAWAGTA